MTKEEKSKIRQVIKYNVRQRKEKKRKRCQSMFEPKCVFIDYEQKENEIMTH